MPNGHHRHGEARRLGAVWAAIFLLFSAAACSLPREARKPASAGAGTSKPYTVKGVRYVPRADPDYDKVGTASWYGGKFHGRRTASGQRYDMYAMTAAHKTLPMGTEVKVTNLANRRSAVLLINDRGPFVPGRIIDVSKRAAEELGFLGAGTTKVQVHAVAGAQPDDRTQAAGRRSDSSERKYFLPVLSRAMDHGTRQGEFIWNDPDGGGGTIVALTSPRAANGPFCRNYRRTARRGAEQTVYIGRACRNGDGSWRIVRERRKG